MPPQMVQQEQRRYKRCDYDDHKDIYEDWPSGNAMWVFPAVCGNVPINIVRRKNSKAPPFHRDRGIIIKREIKALSKITQCLLIAIPWLYQTILSKAIPSGKSGFFWKAWTDLMSLPKLSESIPVNFRQHL
jgi:hypothetical protein